jgi:limonene-1,2-epoxide hydrolase
VRRRLVVLAVAAVAGCGGGDAASPESVVRAWSQSLNADDDEAAAKLFARGAEVIQPNGRFRLDDEGEAELFNRSLPCSGTITNLVAEGDTVRATFLLGDRRQSRCDGPGASVGALFRVRNGKIVLWQQLPGDGDDAETV